MTYLCNIPSSEALPLFLSYALCLLRSQEDNFLGSLFTFDHALSFSESRLMAIACEPQNKAEVMDFHDCLKSIHARI